MFLRVLVIVGLFGAMLVAVLAGPLLVAAVASFVAALALFGSAGRIGGRRATRGRTFTNPFDLLTVLRFAALLAVIMVASKGLTAAFGGRGVILLAAATGLADVDAITLSITRIGGTSLSAVEADIAILVAVTANSLNEVGDRLLVGGRAFGVVYLASRSSLSPRGAGLRVSAGLSRRGCPFPAGSLKGPETAAGGRRGMCSPRS